MTSYAMKPVYDTESLVMNRSAMKTIRRFLDALKENTILTRREPETALDFYTHSAMSTLQQVQEDFKQEQR